MYHSTDLEVHRNWLTMIQYQKNDISNNLNVNNINNENNFNNAYNPIPYFDDESCSEHTLDYPMLFLYFQNIQTIVYNGIFNIILWWTESFWGIGEICEQQVLNDWNLWTMKQDESFHLLSDKTSYCLGFTNYFQNATINELINYEQQISNKKLNNMEKLKNVYNPFLILKKLLLERRKHPIKSYQYPFPFLIIFRFGVIASDILLVFAVYKFFTLKSTLGSRNDFLRIQWYYLLILLQPSLLYLDHIHFQYNGMLLGIMLLSFYYIYLESYLISAFLMSVLLCFKHLYIYVLPAYIITLIIYYVFNRRDSKINLEIKNDKLNKIISRFLFLSFITGVVPFISLLPLFYIYRNYKTPLQILIQIKSRLFPFHRGLTHSYWAPNFWALYNMLDKIISTLLRKKGEIASLTGGVVGIDQGSHIILPKITPNLTMILCLSISFLIVSLLNLKKSKSSKWITFLRSCFHSSMCFFMFGWHVHEKAIVTSMIPLILLNAFSNQQSYSHLDFCFQLIATYSLFPLLFRIQELLSRNILFIGYFLFMYQCIPKIQSSSKKQFVEKLIFSIGILLLEIFSNVIHPYLFRDRMPFLPLMFTSVFCAISLVYLWGRVLWLDLKN